MSPGGAGSPGGPGQAGAAIVAFGDLARDRWGVAVGGPEPQLAIGSLTAGAATDGAPAVVEPLAGTLGACTFAAGGERATVTPAGGAGPLGLSLVSVVLGDDAEPLPGLAYRIRPDRKIDSVRVAGAWFEGDRGLALAASRPRGAKGHDDDRIELATLGESEELLAFDPRLSTTYGAGGAPRRLGVEVWLGESEDADLFPRRVAGEATGAGARGAAGPADRATGPGFAWEAFALRCHSRGEDGTGVYLVLRPAT